MIDLIEDLPPLQKLPPGEDRRRRAHSMIAWVMLIVVVEALGLTIYRFSKPLTWYFAWMVANVVVGKIVFSISLRRIHLVPKIQLGVIASGLVFVVSLGFIHDQPILTQCLWVLGWIVLFGPFIFGSAMAWYFGTSSDPSGRLARWTLVVNIIVVLTLALALILQCDMLALIS